VSVRVNGKGPFQFALETGVTGTMVSTELAHELGLPDMGQAIAGRPGEAAPTRATVTRIDKLELGEAEISGLFVVSADVSTVWIGDHLPQGVLNARFDSPVCSSLSIILRSESNYGVGSFLPWMAGPYLNGMQRAPCRPTPLALNNVKLVVALNLGLASGIDLPERYDDLLRLTSEPVAIPRNKTNTGDGDSNITVATLKRRGQNSVSSRSITRKSGLSTKWLSATLGCEILQRFVVTLDSKNRRIRLESKPGRELP